MLIAAVGLVVASCAEAATPAATPASLSEAAESGQSVTWTQRKLLNFAPPVGKSLADGPLSCDGLVGELRFDLLQLGAGESDLHIDERGCRAENNLSVDATFSVLASADRTGNPVADALTAAHWQTIEPRTGDPDWFKNARHGASPGPDRAFYENVARTVLPLFSTRDVKLVPKTVCDKTGVGLRAQVLMLAPQLAASP
jgi:hypothetical protein